MSSQAHCNEQGYHMCGSSLKVGQPLEAASKEMSRKARLLGLLDGWEASWLQAQVARATRDSCRAAGAAALSRRAGGAAAGEARSTADTP
eukprot:1038181-Pelagomonas_calceolata.AAC.4